MGKPRLGDGFILSLGLLVLLFFRLSVSQDYDRTMMFDESESESEEDVMPSTGVHLFDKGPNIVLTNGLVNLTLSVPYGLVTGVTYKGSENLLDTQNKEDNRGYWDVTWNWPNDHDNMDKFEGTSYKILVQNKDHTEISFTRTWRVGNSRVPLNIDKRYVLLRDSPGFYTYVVLEKQKEWPAFLIQEGRIVFKLKRNKFHYMAMSDERQRVMPMPEDRTIGRCQPLDYKEAVLLTNPSNPDLKGEVDDKYLFSCDNKDNNVHGWVSSELGVGFWMITPSNEFKNGGPFRQDLTSHVGPTMLNMFMSTHYAGEDIAMKFEVGEYWKKVLGPIFIYLNSDVQAKTKPSVLWNNAKERMKNEVAAWPYNFPLSGEFLKSNQRGAVRGQLFVHDWFKNKKAVRAASAYVGLALPGAAGSYQLETKSYQFWTKTDKNGIFTIKNVVPGTYNLFASIPGTLGDYKYGSDIKIEAGSEIDVKKVVFDAMRRGPTLWEIGVPDRTAAEFFIPDPDPRFKMHPYPGPVEKFRQYGLWSRYKDYYPKSDMIFTIGQSNYSKDWFFVHANRNVGGNNFEATTRQVIFDLKNVVKEATYTLQIAIASSNGGRLQVGVNNRSGNDFGTSAIGRDNALARHGIHGLYRMYNASIAGSKLMVGKNTIFFTQTRNLGPFTEIMYDYIRLEGPA